MVIFVNMKYDFVVLIVGFEQCNTLSYWWIECRTSKRKFKTEIQNAMLYFQSNEKATVLWFE